jgi:PepB aminopeptidase
VRDTINAPAEDLGPEQLAQRAVDLLCGVAGDKMSYRLPGPAGTDWSPDRDGG